MHTRLPLRHREQRGIGTLAVSMLLLFGASIVIFYLNRGLIFEQKTSANQMRSTSAFEIAEAGIEWATGMLNSPYDIDTDCNILATTNVSFRRRYLQMGAPASLAIQIASPAPMETGTTRPGCKVNGTTLICNCPAAGGTASLGTESLPSFTVSFALVRDDVNGTIQLVAGAGNPKYDASAVRITSIGCTAQTGACTTGSAAGSDATAVVSVIVKNVPNLRAAPQSALTCGSSCRVWGAYTVRNTEVASNGYLVNAGTTITSSPFAASHYETIPGQPVENARVSDDSSLSALSAADPTCSNSAMFRSYFGVTMAEYAAAPDVLTISCTTTENCGTQLISAYNEGRRDFYFPNGLALNNGSSLPGNTLGVPGDGVRLISPGDIDINGDITINGLIFSNSSNVNDLGTGSADVNGAMISCNSYNNNGSGVLSYDSSNFGNTGLGPGQMVRVPGSWRDFQ